MRMTSFEIRFFGVHGPADDDVLGRRASISASVVWSFR